MLESGGNNGGNFAVTVSQSLGIDKSVDSLALDEYDHVEYIEKDNRYGYKWKKIDVNLNIWN